MEQTGRMNGTVLAVRDLKLSRGDREVLRGVDLLVERGEFVALMGPSGGGKTTVLRAVVGLEAFHGGTIDVDGTRLEAHSLPAGGTRRDLTRKVGMVFQLHHLFEHLTALDNVVLAPVHVQGMARREAENRALQLLDSLGVSHRARALPRELSGGEAQRVAIARALAVDPPLLLMDEPTAALDPARRADLGAALRGLLVSGRTLLVATHDVEFARDHASRVAILSDGRVVEEGSPHEVLTFPRHPATRQLLSSKRSP